MNIQLCRDTSDAVALYLPQRLYLKSFAKINISVQLPSQKVHGKSISNWDLMEKLRKMILPDYFSLLKVTKHSTDVIRFDAELDNRDKLERVLSRMENRIVKLNDFPESLKVKVCECKSDFPSRHAWDSFFRDANDMDEMKPGERPDTVHIANLPIRWFLHEKDSDDALPCENTFKKVFEKFGSVRQVDVPAADPYRLSMKSSIRGISTLSEDSALYFEGYIQFNEYVGFVRCMDALRGKKLMRKKDDQAEWCNIKVDFEKTKHMTDAAVKRRGIVRERFATKQRAKEDVERQENENKSKREAKERQRYENAEKEKLEKTKEREERRKQKQLAKLMERDDVDVNSKVAEEQKKLLKAQKRLQAIRLIEELFKRIELRPELQRHSKHPERYYSANDRSARSRIVENMKQSQQEVVEMQNERFRHALDGRIVIRSALETKKPKLNGSVSSLSSEDDRNYKRVKTEKLTTPEREMEYHRAASLYGMPPYGYGYPFAPYAPTPGFPFQPQNMYYPVRNAYYPPPDTYNNIRRPRGGRGMRGAGRGRGRGLRMPYFEGPDATQQYYKYFKKLTEKNDHDHRSRSHTRSRSRSRSRRRSYSRSRSRSYSHRRSYSRSRSRGRRSRSRSRRSRSKRSNRSRSKSRSRQGSRSRRPKSKSRSQSKHRMPSPKKTEETKNNSNDVVSPKRRHRSKSWSLPKDVDNGESWSKSPRDN